MPERNWQFMQLWWSAPDPMLDSLIAFLQPPPLSLPEERLRSTITDWIEHQLKPSKLVLRSVIIFYSKRLKKCKQMNNKKCFYWNKDFFNNLILIRSDPWEKLFPRKLSNFRRGIQDVGTFTKIWSKHQIQTEALCLKLKNDDAPALLDWAMLPLSKKTGSSPVEKATKANVGEVTTFHISEVIPKKLWCSAAHRCELLSRSLLDRTEAKPVPVAKPLKKMPMRTCL